MKSSEEFLRAPRTPAACPVSCVVVQTSQSRGGAWYQRTAWLMSNHRGLLVEVIVGDDSTESRVFARWPWFSTHESDRYAALTAQVWPMVVNVAPSEFKRLCSRRAWSEDAAKLLPAADRREAYSAVCDAVETVRRDGVGWDRGFNCERTATIYHRTMARGGGTVSEHLRAAMDAFVRDGLVERVSDPDQVMPDGETRQGDIVGQYRATELTP